MNIDRKQLLITIGVAVLIALAGCNTGGATGESLEENTTVNTDGAQIGESAMWEMRMTEKNQMGLVQKRPPFEFDDSLERQNLIERYKHLNDQNNEHYVYLISYDGKVIDHYVAQGKVSSVNSKLTNNKQIVAREDCIQSTHDGGEGACFKTIESPQLDGSYGTNGNAIFFFTVTGEYVEYNGLYLVSEEPKDIRTSPTLVESTGEGVTVVEENSTDS